MKTIKTIFTLLLFSAFLFSCEADQDFHDDNMNVETLDVKAGSGDEELDAGVEEEESR